MTLRADRSTKSFLKKYRFGALAQSVEQWIENPRVPGSIPGGATIYFLRELKKDSMETLIVIIHVIVALFMIIVVLVQGGNQGGIGAALGGGNAQGVFGATGGTSFFGKLTYAAAGTFMVTSLLLTTLQANMTFSGAKSLKDQIEIQAQMKEQEKAALEAKTPATPEKTEVKEGQ